MRRICIILGFLMYALLAQAQVAPQSADQRPADRDEIFKHLSMIFDGFIHQDADALRKLHSTDWRGFLTGSTTVLRGNDAYMNGVKGALTGSVHMATYNIVDKDLMFYGDTAVLPYIVDIQSTSGSKQRLRILDVFAKQNGSWVQVATNTSLDPTEAQKQMTQPASLNDAINTALLSARESVWRSYFAGDEAKLRSLLSEDLVAIDSQSDKPANLGAVLSASRDFANSGGKLTQLEFPTTELQVYGRTAVIYSTYKIAFTKGSDTTNMSGRVAETFVYRSPEGWINTGWQMTSTAAPAPSPNGQAAR